MNIRVTGTICALLWLLVATNSHAADWDKQQSAVWKVVVQSWADEASGNGKWPGSYVHNDVVSWGASWPVPRGKASMEKWSRFGDQNGKMLQYELFPQAIVVSNDTAVVHYNVVSVGENHEKKRKREQGGTIETLVRDGKTWKFLSLTGFDIGGDG